MRHSKTIFSIICVFISASLFSLPRNWSDVLYHYEDDNRTIKDYYEEEDTLQVVAFSNAMHLFNSCRWKEARIAMCQYLLSFDDLNKDYLSTLYYFAKTKLNLGDYASAADSYNLFLFINTTDNNLKDKAEWERALCFMKFNPNKAREYFDAIANDNGHSHQSNAIGLLGIL